MRRHLQSLLTHIENNECFFSDSKDELLMRALTSHLHETAGAIMLTKYPLFWKETDLYFKKALEHIWPEMTKYSHSELLTETDKSLEDITHEVLTSSIKI